MFSSTRHSQYGFNLFELIITLAIAAILIGMAVPSMKSFIDDSEVSSTTNDFVYSLQTARSEAIKRIGPVVVCPSVNPEAASASCSNSSYTRGWIVFFDANRNGAKDGDVEEIIMQGKARKAGFSFDADAVFAQRIYFSETGTSTNVAGVPLSGKIVITYTSDDEERTVRVAANGRITTLDSSSTGSP